jgi:hypothetical protein
VNFGTALGGSVVGGLYGGSGSPASVGQAGAPAASASPTGRTSLMAAAWGTDSSGQTGAPYVAAIVHALALGALVYIWWVLPR